MKGSAVTNGVGERKAFDDRPERDELTHDDLLGA